MPVHQIIQSLPASRLLHRAFWRKMFHAGLLGMTALAISGCGGSVTPGMVEVGDPLPRIKLVALDDGPESLAPFRDRLLVVNIWATWCAPCREEMPSLQRLNDRMDDRRFALVGISIDEDANLVREFLLRYDINFPILLDPDAVETTAELGSLGYPDTLIVDTEGNLLRRVTGLEAWDSPDMIEFLTGHLPAVSEGS